MQSKPILQINKYVYLFKYFKFTFRKIIVLDSLKLNYYLC